MQLKITGLKNTFKVTNFTIEMDTQMTIECEDLIAALEMSQDPVAPPPAPAAPAVKLVEVPEKFGAFTMEQMTQAGWTEATLLEHGYLKEVPADDVAIAPAPVVDVPAVMPPPAKEETGPITHFTHDEKAYRMSPKAAGGTLDQFLSKGWSTQDVIDQGYAERDAVEPPKNADEFPYRNENNEWVDSAGTIFDAERHSMSKDGTPPVTVKGLFKKKRGYKGSKEDVTDPNQSDAAKDVAPPPAKPAPAAPSTSASPAPAAPSAPSASSTDEDIDPELESIIKDWNS